MYTTVMGQRVWNVRRECWRMNMGCRKQNSHTQTCPDEDMSSMSQPSLSGASPTSPLKDMDESGR